MSILFSSPIFGPVHSRRLGISLGINLLPADRKVCSFDCIYCECGAAHSSPANGAKLPTADEVRGRLREVLIEMRDRGERPDVMTFAGNGEPTLHPEFNRIMRDVVALRDEYAPTAKVAVLSNATTLTREDVVEALSMADDAILKIDAGWPETVKRLDMPNSPSYSADSVAERISELRERLGQRLVIQTMFATWADEEGRRFDNATDEELTPWMTLLRQMRPPRLMIYTIDRATPLESMRKTPAERLDKIAEMAREVVPDVTVSY